MKYDCGCINEEHESGLFCCVSKCDFHKQWAKDHLQGESEEYFKEIGALDERGIPQFQNHIKEILDAFNELNVDVYGGDMKAVMEIGCGLGQYIPWFLGNRWRYVATEPADFARTWANGTFSGATIQILAHRFEDFPFYGYDVVFGAHCFEHMQDAPAALSHAYDILNKQGQLWLIIPDDGDPTNPDHLWFVTEDRLKNYLKRVGFKKVKSTMRKIVKQENFIYCVATK